MDENIHILKADEYILHDYFENQIRENQEQEYYITAGIEEIKDMYRSLKDSIQKRQDIIEQYTNQICKTTQVYNEVMNEFVVDGQFKWDWLVAGCKSDTTGEEFQVLPDYPKGKPEELEGIEFDINELRV